MHLVKFATVYSMTLGAVGAATSFGAAPFFGVQTSHWITAGVIQLLALAFAICMNSSGDSHVDTDDCTPCQVATVAISAPLATAMFAFVPLVGAHMLLWMLPGFVFLFIWLFALASVVIADIGD